MTPQLNAQRDMLTATHVAQERGRGLKHLVGFSKNSNIARKLLRRSLSVGRLVVATSSLVTLVDELHEEVTLIQNYYEDHPSPSHVTHV